MSQTDPIPTTSRRALLASVPAALAVSTCTVPVPAAEPNPDAELIALCAKYVALDRAFTANSLEVGPMLSDDPRYEPLCAKGRAMVLRLHELEDLIADTEPHTRTGLLAKAEAARRSLVSNGDDPEEGQLMDSDSYLACAVIENLLAMGGQA